MNDELTPEQRKEAANTISEELARELARPVPIPPLPRMSLHYILYQADQILYEREEAVREGALPEEIAAFDAELAKFISEEVRGRKVDGIVHTIQQWKDKAAEAKRERDNAAAWVDYWENREESLKAVTLGAMRSFNVTHLESATCQLRRQTNGGKQALETSTSLLDDFYLDVTVTLSKQDWSAIVAGFGRFLGSVSVVNTVANQHKIRNALTARAVCDECRDRDGISETIGDCPKCGGAGTVPVQVSGARLLPKGEHLRVITKPGE